MVQAEDILERQIETLMESPSSQVLPSEEDGPTGNFLLQDFLRKRLDDSLEEGYDTDLLLKINHFLEQDVLGGDEDEFDDGQTGKSTKNTDDNVAEQIALLKSTKGKTFVQDTEFTDNYLQQPLVEQEVQILPVTELRPEHCAEYNEDKAADDKSEYYEIQSAKAESEMFTVQDYDGDLEQMARQPPSKPEVTTGDTFDYAEKQSALDEYEFKSAVEFQSVFNFSKHGDAK